MSKMKTIIKIGVMLIGISMLIVSCTGHKSIIASGNVTTQDRTLTGYDGIEVEGAITADVSFSTSGEQIEIVADDNLQQYIEVSISNNVLKIKIRDGISINGRATLKAHIITNPNVDYYRVSGASHIILRDTVKVEDLTLSASGASNVTGAVLAQSTDINLTGASKVSITGTTDNLDLNASGASDLSDFSFTANQGIFDLEGASVARLTINKTIGITASGSSSLVYKGNASVNSSNLTGASTVKKID